MQKCNQTDCDDIGTRVVYWPGKVPPPHMCLLHAIVAVSVAAAMGFDLAIEPIDELREAPPAARPVDRSQ